jgi:glycerophosphoryl diester phosphodiesterase
MHDDTLDRVTGHPGRVRDLTAKELSELRVGGTEPIPLFEEIVDGLPHTRFNVDLKTDDSVEPIVAAIAAHNLHDRILVDSFSQRRISRFRTLTRGRIPTAMAPLGVAWTALVPILSTIISSPAVAVQVPVIGDIGPARIPVVTPQTIARVHQIGKVIHVWTIDDPDEMERLIDLGVDGIVTDRPDLLKEILIRRNLWEFE